MGLPITQCLSPAALGKAYLREMGIEPVLGRSPRFPVARLGTAQTTYGGGRAEERVRLVEVPVAYLDISSNYPTALTLGQLWQLVIADHLRVAAATREARELLFGLDRESLLDREVWPRIATLFCRIRPSGQLLPVRAAYAATGWQIGLNYLDSAPRDLWFTLADLLDNKILGGPPAEILDAFRVVPVGVQPALRPVALRGVVPIDPRDPNLFVHLVEERRRVMGGPSLDPAERRALAGSLKTIANAISYGVYAEEREEAAIAGGALIESRWIVALQVPRAAGRPHRRVLVWPRRRGRYRARAPSPGADRS